LRTLAARFGDSRIKLEESNNVTREGRLFRVVAHVLAHALNCSGVSCSL
jgi:hypothetical protein